MDKVDFKIIHEKRKGVFKREALAEIIQAFPQYATDDIIKAFEERIRFLLPCEKGVCYVIGKQTAKQAQLWVQCNKDRIQKELSKLQPQSVGIVEILLVRMEIKIHDENCWPGINQRIFVLQKGNTENSKTVLDHVRQIAKRNNRSICLGKETKLHLEKILNEKLLVYENLTPCQKHKKCLRIAAICGIRNIDGRTLTLKIHILNNESLKTESQLGLVPFGYDIGVSYGIDSAFYSLGLSPNNHPALYCDGNCGGDCGCDSIPGCVHGNNGNSHGLRILQGIGSDCKNSNMDRRKDMLPTEIIGLGKDFDNQRRFMDVLLGDDYVRIYSCGCTVFYDELQVYLCGKRTHTDPEREFTYDPLPWNGKEHPFFPDLYQGIKKFHQRMERKMRKYDKLVYRIEKLFFARKRMRKTVVENKQPKATQAALVGILKLAIEKLDTTNKKLDTTKQCIVCGEKLKQWLDSVDGPVCTQGCQKIIDHETALISKTHPCGKVEFFKTWPGNKTLLSICDCRRCLSEGCENCC